MNEATEASVTRRLVLTFVVSCFVLVGAACGGHSEAQSAGPVPRVPVDTEPRAASGSTVRPTARVGFIGLPPKGATPSRPARGRLVLQFYGGTTTGPRTRMWVYADGRLIRQQEVNRPYGANPSSTGYLEQRLTPEGVEALRSEAVDTGLFDRPGDLRVQGIGPCYNFVRVRDGDRLARVVYSRGCIFGWRLRSTTSEQAGAVWGLDGRLGTPESWLPASAWADRKIKAYVPSQFAVCYSARSGASPVRAPAVLNLLPRSARELLRAKRPRMHPDAVTTIGGKRLRDEPEANCSVVSTQEARVLADALDTAKWARGDQWVLAWTLGDGVKAPQPITSVNVVFEPIFPHGTWNCSGCG